MIENIILTDIRVKNNTNQTEVFFRNLGPANIHKPLHSFPTRNLKNEEMNQIWGEVSEHPILGKYELKVGCKERTDSKKIIYGIWHLKAPPNEAKTIKKAFGKKFITGNYVDAERQVHGNPYTFVRMKEDTAQAIKSTHEFNNRMRKLKEDILIFTRLNLGVKNPKAYSTRIFNEMNTLFIENRLREIEENSFTKHLTEEQIRERVLLEDIKQDISRFKNIELEENNGFLQINIDKDDFQHQRNFTPDDFNNVTKMYIDIEVPLFKKPNAEISWAGIHYDHKHHSVKELHTLRRTDLKMFKGYRIICYDNQGDFTRGIKNSVHEQDPFIVSAFNAKYDLTKFREHEGDFFIGEEDKLPIHEVTSKFFERIDIRGRMVIDQLREAQIALDFLPNKKLELVSKVALGSDIGLEKIINYDQMEALEEFMMGKDNRFEEIKEIITYFAQIPSSISDEDCIKDTKEEAAKYLSEENLDSARKLAWKITASYQIGDVEIMPKLQDSMIYNTLVHFATHVASTGDIPLSWALYSTRSVQLLLKRKYFRRFGTHKEDLYLNKMRQRKEYMDAKQRFRKYLEEIKPHRTKPGVYKNVHLSSIRYGYHLKDLIYRNNAECSAIFNLKPRNSFEKYIQDRYGNALAEWLIVDFMKIKKQEKKINEILSQNNIPLGGVTVIYNNYKSQFLSGNQYTKSYFQTRLEGSHLQEYSTEMIDEFQNHFKITFDTLAKVINEMKRIENYKYTFRNEHNAEPEEVEIRLHKVIDIIEEYTEKKGLKIIHQEGPYLYMTGDKKKLDEKDERLIIATFANTVITETYKKQVQGEQKIFYDAYGVYHGTKIVDHPSHYLTVFEMNVYKNFFENVFSENYEEAINSVYESIVKLYKQEVTNEELVEYSKATTRFSAFEDGERIYFRDFLEGDIQTDKKTERLYITEEIRGEQKKVFFIEPNQLNPDWEHYHNRFEKRVYDLLYSLIGEHTTTIFDDARNKAINIGTYEGQISMFPFDTSAAASELEKLVNH